jgi:GNAT superfamily N-acetyltransferase
VNVFVRPAQPDDLAVLRGIERAAGERFREFGLDHVADDEPASIETLLGYAQAGRAWVAVGADDDGPLGYILVDEIDGVAHIEQVSVVPDHQGRGVGRALIDQVRRWAERGGRAAITLTTFDAIPWNRPLYEHLGFRVLADHEIGPGLRALREAEAAHGLDPSTRVVMSQDVRIDDRGSRFRAGQSAEETVEDG